LPRIFNQVYQCHRPSSATEELAPGCGHKDIPRPLIISTKM